MSNETLHHTQLILVETKLSQILTEIKNGDRDDESIIEGLSVVVDFIRDNVTVDVPYSLENIDYVEQQHYSDRQIEYNQMQKQLILILD